MNETPETRPTQVWDLPVRLFHWLLVALLGALWFTGENLIDYTDWHLWSGYAVLTLILFRLVWGFVGSTQARFGTFLKGPRGVLAYWGALRRGETGPQVGHNPLGGWMVVVLLVLVTVQAVTGLFATDDIFVEGPLYEHVSNDTASFMTRIHHLNFNLLLGAVAVHVLANLGYLLVKGENLIRPMILGRKPLPESSQVGRIASPLLALPILVLAAAVVWAVVS